MKIPTKKIRKWNSYLKHGDKTRIAKEAGISRVTISEAFNGGSVSDETAAAIQNFIDNKILGEK